MRSIPKETAMREFFQNLLNPQSSLAAAHRRMQEIEAERQPSEPIDWAALRQPSPEAEWRKEQARSAELRRRNQTLEQRVDALEKTVDHLQGKSG
jgi:hypothetical protein